MSRWLLWAPLGILTLGCGLIGLRLGAIAATVTETDVITRYAQKYLSDHGGDAKLSDCMALPADDMLGVWIMVRCQPARTRGSYAYFANRLGGFVHAERPMPATVKETQT